MLVLPDSEVVPSGGFNPLSVPPGLKTSTGADNTFYMGQLDTVVRVSRVHTVWLDSGVANPQWLTPAKGSSLSAALDETAYPATPTSGSTYRFGSDDGGQYIYNWSTKGLPPGFYYRIGVRLDDGRTYTVNIGLR